MRSRILCMEKIKELCSEEILYENVNVSVRNI